jgi:hypothetical protein
MSEHDGNEGKCMACPVEVRGLYAVAYNLLNLYNSQDSQRVIRKLPSSMAELQDAVNKLAPFVEDHFNKHKVATLQSQIKTLELKLPT